jgi:hypothetical protein
MPELWKPNTNYTIDVTNVYDMMMVFQDQIDSEPTPEAKFEAAQIAVRCMARAVRELDDDRRQISFTSDLALVDGSDEFDRDILEGVGITGILDDVHGITIGNRLPLSMSLHVDVMSIFPMGEPIDVGFVAASAIAPISKVHYIETHAA